MVPMSEVRKLEVFHEGHWLEVQLAQITEGDVIRQYEPDGRPVLMHGQHFIKVVSRPGMEVTPFSFKLPEWTRPVDKRPKPDQVVTLRMLDGFEHSNMMFRDESEYPHAESYFASTDPGGASCIYLSSVYEWKAE